MHVLILPSWYPESRNDVTGCFFREQAAALRRAGFRVGVLAPLYRSLRNVAKRRRHAAIASFEDDDGVPTIRVPILNIFPRIADLEAWNTIRLLRQPFDDYVREFGVPDIVHLHSLLPAGEFAGWLSNTRKLPFVVTEHSTAYGRNLVPANRLRRARRITRKARCRIAVSRPFAELLTAKLGSDVGQWIRIPNIVSKAFFASRKPRTVTRSDNPAVFLCIGSLDQKKRIDLLINAFSKAFSANPRYHLRIGGVGPERTRLEALAAKLGIASCVTFLGALSRAQVVREMHDASVFVLGSDSETFGVVLIEALAMGLPIVATACGGPEDIVNEANGLLVPRGDVDAMAAAMRQIFANVDKYDPIRISRDCEERFGEHAVCERLKLVYETVLTEVHEVAPIESKRRPTSGHQ